MAMIAFCSLASCKMVDKTTTYTITSLTTGSGKSVRCVESRERELKVAGLDSLAAILERILEFFIIIP